MDTNELLGEFQKTKAAYDTLVKEKGRALLDGIFRQMLGASPSIRKIGWTQYTPHFNDGDACEFSVHDRYACLSDEDEDSDSLYDWAAIGSTYDERWSALSKDEAGEVARLNKILSRLDDVMEGAFGDHVRVIASRAADGGVAFEVEEYEHD